MIPAIKSRIELAIGAKLENYAPLTGGCIAEVYLLNTNRGAFVCKLDSTGRLQLEGRMLSDLRKLSKLPVPTVVSSDPDLLIMEHLPGKSSFSAASERDAAVQLAALHAITNELFGFEYDTLIGGMHQPNPPTHSWADFFANHRLRNFAERARNAGKLSPNLYERIELLAADLPDLLPQPKPSLLHGDVWTGNVLADNASITGFLDPAVYFGHNEVEIAFIRWLGTFGENFYRAYASQFPLDKDFFQRRDYIYRSYPILVHVLLFGGGYPRSLDENLQMIGY